MTGEAAIRVVVQGALGRMGTEILGALEREANMQPVGAIDMAAQGDTLGLPSGTASVPLSGSLSDVIGGADVLVDVTNADGALAAIRTAAEAGVGVVIGSSGIPESTLDEARSLAARHGIGIVVVPNFAIGGVVMTHLARIAAKFFDYADLVETHHEKKIDAPSGTAMAIARAVIEGKGGPMTAPEAEKETITGTRGGDLEGVTIHSARLPGRVAHHELVFAGPGQTLTLRHDSIDRSGFMPGVIAAVRAAAAGPGLTVGLEEVLGLK
jgi:4-hydroxy-tetrahydrodipicolinate reductase